MDLDSDTVAVKNSVLIEIIQRAIEFIKDFRENIMLYKDVSKQAEVQNVCNKFLTR